MNKVLKSIFHISVLFLIIISLWPGSLIGFLLYYDWGQQPNLIKNPFGTTINHFICYLFISLVGFYIYAKNDNYDKENHNTSFYNEVKIEYLDNLINSDRLDLNFTDGISKIYNNVIVASSNFKLNTDKILIDMVTGDIKLEMLKKSDKVKLITNYEFIN